MSAMVDAPSVEDDLPPLLRCPVLFLILGYFLPSTSQQRFGFFGDDGDDVVIKRPDIRSLIRFKTLSHASSSTFTHMANPLISHFLKSQLGYDESPEDPVASLRDAVTKNPLILLYSNSVDRAVGNFVSALPAQTSVYNERRGLGGRVTCTEYTQLIANLHTHEDWHGPRLPRPPGVSTGGLYLPKWWVSGWAEDPDWHLQVHSHLRDLSHFLLRLHVKPAPKEPRSLLLSSLGGFKVYDHIANFEPVDILGDICSSNIFVPSDHETSKAVFVRFTKNLLSEWRHGGNEGTNEGMIHAPNDRGLYLCFAPPSCSSYVPGGVYSGVYLPSLMAMRAMSNCREDDGHDDDLGPPVRSLVLESPSLPAFLDSFADALRSGTLGTSAYLADHGIEDRGIDLMTRSVGEVTTRGVRVQAGYQYIAEKDPSYFHLMGQQQLGFAYSFQITHDASVYKYVQLKTRHWRFTREDGTVEEVDGGGVIGMFPFFDDEGEHDRCEGGGKPRPENMKKGTFVYASCTGSGGKTKMEGKIGFVGVRPGQAGEDGTASVQEAFDVIIPCLEFKKDKTLFGFI